MREAKIGPTKQAIIEILVSLQLKYGKAYCFPTQKKILSLLEEFHGIKIQRRALNYALADLVAAGMISRVRRIKHSKTGEMIFKSTLYFIKQIGHKIISSIKKYGQKIYKWQAVCDLNRAQRRLENKHGGPASLKLTLIEAV
jgi:hypothetical protein